MSNMIKKSWKDSNNPAAYNGKKQRKSRTVFTSTQKRSILTPVLWNIELVSGGL